MSISISSSLADPFSLSIEHPRASLLMRETLSCQSLPAWWMRSYHIPSSFQLMLGDFEETALLDPSPAFLRLKALSDVLRSSLPVHQVLFSPMSPSKRVFASS